MNTSTKKLHSNDIENSNSEIFGLNVSVADNLDKYINRTQTKFAVLIKGAWGCGKTFFIRRYIIEKENQTPTSSEINKTQEKSSPTYCYVSLFDITCQKDIDSAILAKTNPILNNENAKNIGRFGVWALDKLPIVPQETSELLEKAGGLLSSFFNKMSKDLVIVLDDLERSKLPIQEILGYASSLLEENNAKVILLCNEDELCSGETNTEQKTLYNKFKEKVVGVTQTIISDPHIVLEELIKTVSNTLLKQALKNSKETILEIYEKFKFTNLRSLENFVFEAELIGASLSVEVLKDEKSMKAILQALFIFSYIKKNGKTLGIDFKNLLEHTGAFPIQLLFSKKDNPNEFKQLNALTDYIREQTDEEILFWENFFANGKVGNELNKYFLGQLTNSLATPMKLRGFYYFERSQLEQDLTTMLTELKNKEYKEPSIILNAYDLLLVFSEIGVYKIEKKEIVNNAKRYINDIKVIFLAEDLASLENSLKQIEELPQKYSSYETKEFKTIVKILKAKFQSWIDAQYKNNGLELGNLLGSPEKFIEKTKQYTTAQLTMCLPYIDLNKYFDSIIISTAIKHTLETIVFDASHPNDKQNSFIDWLQKFKALYVSKADELAPLQK